MARKMMVNTFETLQTLFSQDLHELQCLRKRMWFALSMSRVVKEEHIGRCCYLAEEFLSTQELIALKQELGLDEQSWLSYKTKISKQ
jgi:hypothetical protein